MAYLGAFTPVGPTSKIAAAATAPTAVTLAGDTKQSLPSEREYRIQNNGGETAFYAWGVDAATAALNVVIPTNASVGGSCYPISAGAIEVIRAPIGQYWTGITVTNAVSLFITPGKGM
jgi:hypothetical protein